MSALYQFTFTAEPDDAVDDSVVMIDALIDAYLTPAQLARALGVSRDSVYGWRDGNHWPQFAARVRIEQLYAHLTGWDAA